MQSDGSGSTVLEVCNMVCLNRVRAVGRCDMMQSLSCGFVVAVLLDPCTLNDRFQKASWTNEQAAIPHLPAHAA